MVDGEVVGAIGTSGETPDEDEAISIAGAAADVLDRRGARADLRRRAAGGRGRRRRGARRGVAPGRRGRRRRRRADVPLAPRRAPRSPASSVTTDKARTAAIYRRPSKDFEDQASGGRPSALHLARAVPLQGGIPIVVRRRGRRRDRRQRRLVGRRGPGARRASARAPARPPQRTATGNGAAFFASATRARRKFADGRPAARRAAATSSTPAGARRRARSSTTSATVDVMHVVRGHGDGRHRRRDGRAREVAPGELRARAIDGGPRTSSPRATCSRSRAACRTSSSRSPTRSCTSS